MARPQILLLLMVGGALCSAASAGLQSAPADPRPALTRRDFEYLALYLRAAREFRYYYEAAFLDFNDQLFMTKPGAARQDPITKQRCLRFLSEVEALPRPPRFQDLSSSLLGAVVDWRKALAAGRAPGPASCNLECLLCSDDPGSRHAAEYRSVERRLTYSNGDAVVAGIEQRYFPSQLPPEEVRFLHIWQQVADLIGDCRFLAEKTSARDYEEVRPELLSRLRQVSSLPRLAKYEDMSQCALAVVRAWIPKLSRGERSDPATYGWFQERWGLALRKHADDYFYMKLIVPGAVKGRIGDHYFPGKPLVL